MCGFTVFPLWSVSPSVFYPLLCKAELSMLIVLSRVRVLGRQGSRNSRASLASGCHDNGAGKRCM